MNMPGRMRDLARHTGAYGVATVAGGITRAALVPVIARFLGTEEYGRASVVLILITLLTIVFDLGQSSSLIKFVNEAPDDEEKRKVISTVLAASLLFSLSFVVVLLAVSGRLSGLLLGSEAYGGLVLMGVAGGFGNALLQIGLSYERAVARSFRYVTYTVLKGALSLVLTIVLIVVLQRGAHGLLAGLALPPLAIGIAIYGQRAARFSLTLSRRVFTKVIDFGLPLVPMNLAMWVLAYSDIYLLRRLLRPEVALSEVGLYQYAHEICLVLVLPVTSLNLAWPQFLFSNHSKDGAPEVFARVHRYFSFFVIGMAFVLSMFSYHVIGFVGSRPYMGCSGVVPLLAGSLVFYGLSILYASGLYVAGKTRILAAVVICCSALNVLLNLLLIPALGKEGAASATLVTNLIMAASLLALSGRHYRIPFSLAPAVLSVCVGAAAVAGHRLVADDALGGGNPGLAALGTAVFSAATLALYRMGPGEIRKGAILLRSTLKRGGP
jgi:O-antigen/teichoic acid export membrane protein